MEDITWDVHTSSEDLLIEVCEKAEKKRGHYHEYGRGYMMVKLSDDIAVKTGLMVYASEARTQEFANQNADPSIVHIPKVSRYFNRDEPGSNWKVGYLFMEYMEGPTFADFNFNSRPDIVPRMARIVAHLGQIQGGQVPGPVGGGRAQGYIHGDEGADVDYGSVLGFNAYLNRRLRIHDKTIDLSGQPLVLCHMDLGRRNVILKEDDTISLVNWNYAGLYPRFFEVKLLSYLNPWYGPYDRALQEAIAALLGLTEEEERLMGYGHLAMKFYPQAKQPKRHLSSTNPTLRDIRLQLFKAIGGNFIILQVLFFALYCYIFGALYQQGSHIHNLTVAFVDYDGGAIGAAVRDAYKQLQGDGFPELIELSPQQYAQPSTLESKVCHIDFWAALYISPNASNRLAEGLTGGIASSSYNRSDVLSFIWNEARYSTTSDSVETKLQDLSEAARIAYSNSNGAAALQTLPAGDTAAVSVFSNPWQLVSINLQPTTQGSRLIYNTLVIILILLQEFFYLGIINGLYARFKIYGRIRPHRIIVVRLTISILYTFVGSLCTTGAIWVFRAGWNVNGVQFVLTWMSLWLFAHLNFLTFDVFSVWLPPPVLPLALVSWIMLNITSILLPLALSPRFYHWSYAMPTHSVYNLLIDIWSRGCNPVLHYALPVMFAYELSGLILSALGVYRRSHYGFIDLEKEEKAFQAKIAESLATAREEESEEGEGRERRRPEAEAGEEEADVAGDGVGAAVPIPRRGTIITPAGREELAQRIWRETKQLRKERSRTEADDNFGGPCFDLAFDNK
ncbi:hypothetical protein VE03_05475 [Pseudogymnoascus sp. 23342-1-I1]|nr:hypothetical protein VE03_05475 [Pseudogymnoascus sp. 23342-1-I1]